MQQQRKLANIALTIKFLKLLNNRLAYYLANFACVTANMLAVAGACLLIKFRMQSESKCRRAKSESERNTHCNGKQFVEHLRGDFQWSSPMQNRIIVFWCHFFSFVLWIFMLKLCFIYSKIAVNLNKQLDNLYIFSEMCKYRVRIRVSHNLMQMLRLHKSWKTYEFVFCFIRAKFFAEFSSTLFEMMIMNDFIPPKPNGTSKTSCVSVYLTGERNSSKSTLIFFNIHSAWKRGSVMQTHTEMSVSIKLHSSSFCLLLDRFRNWLVNIQFINGWNYTNIIL